MHCVGCAIARFETLAEACAVYGVPVERLLDELRERAPEADRESEGNA
jgi:hybrid cluster-associated redox disulfide protein